MGGVRLQHLTESVEVRWIGFAVIAAYWLLVPADPSTDAVDYYLMDFADPYASDWGAQYAFVYSPVYATILAPFTALPFELFYKVTTAVDLVALVYLLGPVFGALALPLAHPDISNGQIHLPLAAIAVLMVRHPWAWPYHPLTKVTPGVTLLWFVGRREWRFFLEASAMLLILVGISYAFFPDLWAEWIALLTESSTRHVGNFTVSEWPAIFRLPIGAGLAYLAGRRNRPGALPVIVLFVLPAIWWPALVMLLAIPKASSRR
jgi:uncharacterized protein YjeT (DUF2065 family)